MEVLFPQRPDSLRLPDFDYFSEHAGYFLTACTADRRRIFSDALYAGICFRVIDSYHGRDGWALPVICVMPDHFHVLAYDHEGKGVSNLVRQIKTLTTRRLRKADYEGDVWQRSFYDHVLRPSERPGDVISYIAANPVQSGLVEDYRNWPWTAFNLG